MKGKSGTERMLLANRKPSSSFNLSQEEKREHLSQLSRQLNNSSLAQQHAMKKQGKELH